MIAYLADKLVSLAELLLQFADLASLRHQIVVEKRNLRRKLGSVDGPASLQLDVFDAHYAICALFLSQDSLKLLSLTRNRLFVLLRVPDELC